MTGARHLWRYVWALPNTSVPLRGALRRHELAHVGQYERLGPAFIPVYVGLWLVRYRRHPLELAASRAEQAGGPGG